MTDRNARVDAIDVLRGFVMVLMSIDHASDELNAGRLVTDSALFYIFYQRYKAKNPRGLGQYI